MMPREPEEQNNDAPETAVEATEEPEEATVAEDEKAAEYLARWQRAQADFINYKRRVEQERQEFVQFANAELVKALLPVMDDLDRALEHIPPKFARNDWVQGVEAVARKFRNSLEARGVKPIEALGQPFDPNFHEALRQDRGEEGIVTEEYQKGYMLHDKLLRPSRVVVGNGEEDKLQTPEEPI